MPVGSRASDRQEGHLRGFRLKDPAAVGRRTMKSCVCLRAGSLKFSGSARIDLAATYNRRKCQRGRVPATERSSRGNAPHRIRCQLSLPAHPAITYPIGTLTVCRPSGGKRPVCACQGSESVRSSNSCGRLSSKSACTAAFRSSAFRWPGIFGRPQGHPAP